jgi:hypothetical protein
MSNFYLEWFSSWPDRSLALLAKAQAKEDGIVGLNSVLHDPYLAALREEIERLVEEFKSSSAARKKIVLLDAAIAEACLRQRYRVPAGVTVH